MKSDARAELVAEIVGMIQVSTWDDQELAGHIIDLIARRDAKRETCEHPFDTLEEITLTDNGKIDFACGKCGVALGWEVKPTPPPAPERNTNADTFDKIGKAFEATRDEVLTIRDRLTAAESAITLLSKQLDALQKSYEVHADRIGDLEDHFPGATKKVEPVKAEAAPSAQAVERPTSLDTHWIIPTSALPVSAIGNAIGRRNEERLFLLDLERRLAESEKRIGNVLDLRNHNAIVAQKNQEIEHLRAEAERLRETMVTREATVQAMLCYMNCKHGLMECLHSAIASTQSAEAGKGKGG